MKPQLIPLVHTTTLETTSNTSSPAQPCHTAPPSPLTAGSSTFDTIELLEHILLQLEPVDQVIAHQVCKTWKTVINSSARLRRSAFPWLDPVITTAFLVWTYNQQDTPHPWQPRISSEHSDKAMTIFRQNPIFATVLNSGFKTLSPMTMDAKKILAWDPDGLWRNQLLFQPPIAISKICTNRGDTLLFGRHGACSGVTLGDLYDVLEVGFTDPKKTDRPVDFHLSGCMAEESVPVMEAREYQAKEIAEKIKVPVVSEIEAQEDRNAAEAFANVFGEN